MSDNSKYAYLSFALIISIVAAVLIEIVFIVILRSGIMTIFNFPYITLLISLLILGIINNKMFLISTNHSRMFFRNVTPISLVIAGLGIVVGYLGNFAGPFLIFIAYIFEILTGIKLKNDLMIISKKWSTVFIVGVAIFVLSMPLLLYNLYLILIPMLGDAIKTIGLYFIYKDLNNLMKDQKDRPY